MGVNVCVGGETSTFRYPSAKKHSAVSAQDDSVDPPDTVAPSSCFTECLDSRTAPPRAHAHGHMLTGRPTDGHISTLIRAHSRERVGMKTAPIIGHCIVTKSQPDETMRPWTKSQPDETIRPWTGGRQARADGSSLVPRGRSRLLSLYDHAIVCVCARTCAVCVRAHIFARAMVCRYVRARARACLLARARACLRLCVTGRVFAHSVCFCACARVAHLRMTSVTARMKTGLSRCARIWSCGGGEVEGVGWRVGRKESIVTGGEERQGQGVG